MRAIWQEVKNIIQSELPKSSFSLWIDPLTFLEKNNGTVVLGCPNKFSKNWVAENYRHIIHKALEKAGLPAQHLKFKVQKPINKDLLEPLSSSQQQLTLPDIAKNISKGFISLNKDYTFDRFVVGPCNEFAYSASQAMARETNWTYNMLLMLAGTGLGKSHLSQAVCHTILEQNPRTRVYYITAEEFTNEMIFSLRNKCIDQFKKKYREACDVLLLEEVHFLSGKEKTQQELGHTLDALANDNKKIIFTSSLPPKDIPSMSEDLSSRLTAGLVTKIEAPDFDTRVKILSRKAADLNMDLSDTIIQLLAENLTRDIRQMQSALNCLKAKSELLKENINTDLVKEVLNCLTNTKAALKPEHILNLVCKYYKISEETLKSKSRKKIHSYPRNILIYLCRKQLNETLDNISKLVNRSHSTILYAIETVEYKRKSDAKIRKEIEFLTRKLKELPHDQKSLSHL